MLRQGRRDDRRHIFYLLSARIILFTYIISFHLQRRLYQLALVLLFISAAAVLSNVLLADRVLSFLVPAEEDCASFEVDD